MRSDASWYRQTRLQGLRRFAVAITVLNVAGHTVLGFEQSIAHPLAALAAAYATEALLEIVDARVQQRRPRFLGGTVTVIDFFLSAHISGLAVAMLLYPGDRLGPIVMAAVVAIASKSLIRMNVPRGSRHVFNPSNLGITIVLLTVTDVGIAPPYHFTERLGDVGDWILPGAIVLSGTFLNARFTGRMPLIASWLTCFAAQAIVRSAVAGAPPAPALLPMTGVAFILYTFYMVTDPATTPEGTRGQIAFGAAVAAAYGLLMTMHVVFGLFFALSIVSALRGLGTYALAHAKKRREGALPEYAVAGRARS